jgi:putative DNA primase/helicase
VLYTNHKPRITGRDTGIWRRVVLFPFEWTCPKNERDPDFKEKMIRADGGYIAWWLLDGCKKYLQSGYGEFETVENATEEYRSSEDTIGHFLEEYCVMEQGAETPANILRLNYERWAKENGEHIFSGRAWREALEEHGLSRRKTMYGQVWQGVKLVTNYENDTGY